jgi:hypothetical protein
MKQVKKEQTLTDQKYPSQINTKTISCRISSADYVQFLQDAISKSISLNDWLLMKIYNQHTISGNATDDKHKEVYENLIDSLPKWYKEFDPKLGFEVDTCDDEESALQSRLRHYAEHSHEFGIKDIKSPEGLIYVINQLSAEIDNAWLQFSEYRRKERKPSINEVKAQILTLAQGKFDVRKDIKDFMAEVNELLEELA